MFSRLSFSAQCLKREFTYPSYAVFIWMNLKCRNLVAISWFSTTYFQFPWTLSKSSCLVRISTHTWTKLNKKDSCGRKNVIFFPFSHLRFLLSVLIGNGIGSLHVDFWMNFASEPCYICRGHSITWARLPSRMGPLFGEDGAALSSPMVLVRIRFKKAIFNQGYSHQPV